MADIDDDDEFGLDDALDDLQDNDLYQLEHNALLSTQHNRAVLNNVQKQRLVNQDSFASDRTLVANRPPSGYGLNDEDVIDLDEQPFAVQQAYNQGNKYNRFHHQQQRDADYGAEVGDDSYQTAMEDPQVDVAGLQALLLQVSISHFVLGGDISEWMGTFKPRSHTRVYSG